MIDALPLLLSDEGYQISRSVRLRSSASAYLQRTNATTGTDPLKFTVSGWIKRGSTVELPLLGSATGSNAFDFFGFWTGDILVFRIRNSSSVDLVRLESSAVFRDYSAWYHIVAAYDSANATSTERLKMYVNGVQLTAFGTATYPPLNQGLTGDFLTDMQIGRTNTNSTNQNYGDGYITEVNFIDGQALTPASFGEIDAVTGVWKPKKYAGTYGTNGFYLNFSDNTGATATTIGKDYSGNGNNWTPNNISVTSGVTYDSMLDVPTQWADGGNGRGNYCVINPLSAALNGGTISWANLRTFGAAAGGSSIAYGSFTLDAGKWYFEVFADSNGGFGQVSVGFEQGYYFWVGNGGTYSSYGWYAVAIDFDAGKIWVKNTAGNWVSGNPETGASPSFTFTPNTPLRPACFTSRTAGSNNAGYGEWNFGQQPYNFTPPTGFKALNTQNLP